MNLLIDFCDYDAAKYTVMHWHYSKAMPSGKLIRFGVWEDKRFIGVVLYGRGACNNIGTPYGLVQTEICELVRVALKEHTVPVTRIISGTIKKLKIINPGIKLIVSFADTEMGHAGIIYQAGNWIYTGTQDDNRSIMINGKIMHRRSAGAKYGTYEINWIKEHIDKNAKRIFAKPKHRYLMPLNKRIRKQVLKLSKPYPKHIDK